MDLLKKLCAVQATAGSEYKMKDFLLDFVQKNKSGWKYEPEIYAGDELMDNMILKFGNPKTAVFAHVDTVGFTVRYENQLIPVGSPDVHNGYKLVGEDVLGPIECTLKIDEDDKLFYKFGRSIFRGTPLTFKPNFREDDDYIQCCYLDNRLGVYNALKVAEHCKDGLFVFTTGEEHGGGSVPYLMRYIYERWPIKYALISDITWVTDGVHPGEGVVISMRDRNIPRQAFVRKVTSIAEKNNIDYQLEVEASGSSDGREVHHSPYPVDWCFIGAPEENVHSPDEKVHKKDIRSMINLYRVLMRDL